MSQHSRRTGTSPLITFSSIRSLFSAQSFVSSACTGTSSPRPTHGVPSKGLGSAGNPPAVLPHVTLSPLPNHKVGAAETSRTEPQRGLKVTQALRSCYHLGAGSSPLHTQTRWAETPQGAKSPHLSPKVIHCSLSTLRGATDSPPAPRHTSGARRGWLGWMLPISPRPRRVPLR